MAKVENVVFGLLYLCDLKKNVFLPPSGLELPRINYDTNGERHRFVYGSCVEESALSKQVRFRLF